MVTKYLLVNFVALTALVTLLEARVNYDVNLAIKLGLCPGKTKFRECNRCCRANGCGLGILLWRPLRNEIVCGCLNCPRSTTYSPTFSPTSSTSWTSSTSTTTTPTTTSTSTTTTPTTTSTSTTTTPTTTSTSTTTTPTTTSTSTTTTTTPTTTSTTTIPTTTPTPTVIPTLSSTAIPCDDDTCESVCNRLNGCELGGDCNGHVCHCTPC